MKAMVLEEITPMAAIRAHPWLYLAWPGALSPQCA
jgi:hypothetical protein